MEIIYKSNQETKRRGLGWKDSVLLKEKHKHFNLEME